jgi:tight adherence protein B
MFYILLSVLIGAIIGYIVINLGPEEKSSPIERLYKIKAQSQKKLDDVPDEYTELFSSTEYKIQALGEFLSKYNFFNNIKKQLKIADIDMKPDVFILISVVPAFFFLLLGMLNFAKSYVFVVLAAIAVFIPSIMVKIRIKKRYNLFTIQFPDTLDLICSSLRAGHSLLSAFQMIAKEMPEPISQIFKYVSDDISLGRDTRDALDSMTELLPMSIDLRFFVTAVLIQREIGGNLAEILDNLNYTIRERFKLLGQISTQTAQAKLSGIILAITPFILACIISVLNPTYLHPLFHTLIGQTALVVAILMAGIGYLIINKITNIRV